MLINSGSLVATTAVTSVFGVAFWWLVARRFPPEAVGIASASISAMMLLGTFSMLGMGTLLITEIGRQPRQAAALISTAVMVVGFVGGCAGGLFALAASLVSSDFHILRASLLNTGIFAAGISLAAIAEVIDQALVGLLLGALQLLRNTLFALGKLLAILGAGFWLVSGGGIAIYGAWIFGSFFSLVIVAMLAVVKKGRPGKASLPQWSLLKKLGGAALQHHLLNLVLQAPPFALPILVTLLLSARVNAWFYVAWMIASFLFYISLALTMVLHAMNAAKPEALAQSARVTMGISLVVALCANGCALFGAQALLGLFGQGYATQATTALRILALAAFPLAFKNHYIAICRIRDRIANAMVVMVPGSFLEVGAAAMGAHLGGLPGLSAGWLTAVTLEAALMFRTVRLAMHNTIQQPAQVAQRHSHTAAAPALEPVRPQGVYAQTGKAMLSRTARSFLERQDS